MPVTLDVVPAFGVETRPCPESFPRVQKETGEENQLRLVDATRRNPHRVVIPRESFHNSRQG